MSSLRSLSMLYIQSLSLQHLLYPVTFLYSPLLLPFSYPFSSPFPLLAFPSFTLLFSFDFALYFCPSHILSFPTFALFLSSSQHFSSHPLTLNLSSPGAGLPFPIPSFSFLYKLAILDMGQRVKDQESHGQNGKFISLPTPSSHSLV